MPVVSAQGLRPTGERIRETVFNWLAADIIDATCLDLFAGSGVFGLEALSRGAARSIAIEQNRDVFRQLLDIKERLNANQYEPICADAIQWLATCEIAIDIIFIDPPFAENLWGELAELVAASRCFKPGAKLYLEQQDQCAPWPAPTGWHMLKGKQAGAVRYQLYEFSDI